MKKGYIVMDNSTGNLFIIKRIVNDMEGEVEIISLGDPYYSQPQLEKLENLTLIWYPGSLVSSDISYDFEYLSNEGK